MSPFTERLKGFLLAHGRALGIVAVACVLPVVLSAAYVTLPTSSDWNTTFRPATLELLAGRTPYRIRGFYNAPWLLIPLVPLAALPPQLSRAVLFVVTLVVYGYVAVRLGARPAALVAFLLSYPMFRCVAYGQIDWLVSLGFILPPQIGLFFALAKPQIGLAPAVFWLTEAWRTGGIWEVVRVFGPVLLGFGLSYLV